CLRLVSCSASSGCCWLFRQAPRCWWACGTCARPTSPAGSTAAIDVRQLPLQISAPAEPRFENYLAGANVDALARVRALAAGGLRLSDEVVWYLLNHLPRDLGSLHRVLEVLDRYSLASQRAVTLPLVREALSAAQDCANWLDKPARPE